MSVTWHLILLAAAAVAVMAILVVGTLVAADIIHLGHREATDPAPEEKEPREEPGDRESGEELVESLAPLGSSLAAGAVLGGSHVGGEERR